MRARICAGAVALALLIVAGLPGSALAAAGQISGTVTDAATGAALPEVDVEVYDSSDDFVASASTNPAGEYTLLGLAPGSYKVGFYDEGDDSHLVQFYNGRATLDSADPVVVTGGSATSGIDASLAQAGTVAGKVTDATTQSPVEGVDVQILDSAGDDVGDDSTDASGRYSVGGLPTGSYRVEFLPASGQPYGRQFYSGRSSLAAADPVSVTGGKLTDGIDAQLVAGARFSGTVTGAATGNRVPDAQVSVFAPDGTPVTVGQADDAGRYVIGGLAPGPYKLEFSTPYSSASYGTGNYGPEYYDGKETLASADTLTATAGQATTANGSLGPGGQIDGKVTDAQSQQALSDVDVVASDSEGNVVGEAWTQEDGSYQLTGLGTGSYAVSFAPDDNEHVSEYYNGRSTSSDADHVAVTVGQATTGIDAALAVGGAISGKVADSSGAPVGNVLIDAYDASGTIVDEQSTGSDGQYMIGGLSGGDYRLEFVPEQASAYAQQFYAGAASLNAATPVSVALGQTTTGIDATMSGGGSIDGVVTDATSGQGLADVEVDVLGQNGSYADSVTDAGGHYSVGGLASGTYTATFTELSGSHLPQIYDGKSPSESGGDPISVTSGQATPNIDAALGLAGKINGTVTDAATGKPIAGVSVDASSANSDGYAATAADGTYSIGGLPAGTYTVSFSTYGSDDHATQYYNGRTSGASPDPVSVAAGQTTSSIDAAMTTGGAIAGTVTDASTGDPVACETVIVYDSSGNYVSSTSTASDGSYTVGGLPGGSYRVGFSEAYCDTSVPYTSTFYNGKATLASSDPVSVTPGQTTGNIDEALPPTTGAIAGTVSDGPLGAPLPQASVSIYTTSGAQVGSATTDADGRYRVVGLPAGSYLVGFAASGYGTQFSAGKSSLASADPVSVSSGQTTDSIDAMMKRQGVIEGTVTGAPGGTALAGVTVEIVDSYGDWDETSTDATGGYAFSGLAAGSYQLEFIPAPGTNYLTEYYNGEATQATADSVAVSDGSVIQGVDAELPVGGEITGQVTSASTGDPLPNVSVSASGASGDGYGTATTDGNGDYTIVGLPTDSYYVSYQDPAGSYLDQQYAHNPVAVSAGQTTTAIDGAMQPAAKISGTVTDTASQQPIAGIQATAYDANGDYITSTDTDNNGAYTLADLPTGSYRVEFSNDYALGGYLTQYYNARASLATADPVTATAGQTTNGINAAMQAGGRVTGTVTDASTATGIADILATVYDANGNSVASAITSRSGSYTIVGLPTGSYTVGFTDDGSGGDYQGQYYNGRLALANADPISVSAGQTTEGIDAAMVTGGKITGTVTDASTHSAVSGANVYVYDANGDYVGTAYTGPDGSYTVSSLPTGSYRIEVVGPGLYVAQYYNGKTTLASADPIAVTAGQTTSKIDVELQNGGVISGNVTDSATGQPIVGATVYVSGPGAYRSTTTDSNGDYAVSGLTTGSDIVEFSAAGYLTQYYDNRAAYNSADAVAVTTGQTTSSINASMQLGATITGTVTDAGSGKPIAGEPVFAETAGGQVTATANTDASGHYQLIGLPTGSYDVGFGVYGTGPNYVPQYYGGQQCQNSPGSGTSAVQAEYGGGSVSCTPASAGATAVAATAGQTTAGIDAAMNRGAQLTGTVTRADTGAAVSSITVTAYDSSGDYLGETSTATNGTYTLDALPAGTYKVGFSDGRYPRTYLPQYYNGKSSLAAGDAINLATAQSLTGIDAAMQDGGQITGTVTDAATQQPLSNVSVTAYDSSGNYVGYANVSSNGTYALTGLATGSYRVEFNSYVGGYLPDYYNGKGSLSTADPVAVIAGSATNGIDGALSRGGSISGTITDAAGGAAISGVTVSAYTYSGASLSYVGSSTTDGSGHYTITGLSTGSYKVQFSAAGYLTQAYNNRQSLTSGDPVSVTYGQTTTGIDATLVRGATITGTVTDASTQAGVFNAFVTAYDSQGLPVVTTSTSSNGSYQLTVPAGSYSVGFTEGVNQNYLPQYYSGQSSLSAANQITVSGGQTVSGIDAALQSGGQITGTVTDASTGSPVSGIWVYAMTTGGQYLTSAQTNSQGNYSLGGLTTGSYTVEFYESSSTENYLPQYYDGKTTLQNADAIPVTAGQATTGIDAAMQPGGQITGTVTSNATGKPIPGVEVTASGGSTYDNATTDANGNYTLNNLPTGSYQLYFSDPQDLHLPQYYDDAATSANATSVAVSAGQTEPGIDAALAPAGRITGSVLDAENGGPVSGATVTLYDAGDNYVTSTSTDGTGSYSFGPLAAGQYEVSFATGSSGGNYATAYYNGKSSLVTADPVTVTNEATTSGVNGQLTSLPVNTGLPTISGTAKQGQTLTEVNGKWTNQPTSYSYQWLRCQAGGTSCSWIPNATAQTYTATADDVGDVIEVSETATNGGGPGLSATSAPTSVVLPAPPVNTAPPSIAGRAQQGKALTEEHGAWTNNPTGYAYQWLRCAGDGSNCAAINGATSQSYVPTADDVGSTLEVQETASNAGGASSPAASSATAIVVPPVPVSTGRPSIEGVAQQGQTLTEQHGSWTNQPTGYSYQWLTCDSTGANCTPIAGATGQTYTPTGDDVGLTLAVAEIATNVGGDGAPATSGATAVVLPAPPVNQALPGISGTAQQGQTLIVQQGTWTNNPTSLTEQWLRCDSAGVNCAPIDGATGQEYTPVAADVGATIAVAETASNAGGASAPADTGATAIVKPAPPSNSALPSIAGTPQQGQTLSEQHGEWNNDPTAYAYQWLRCDASGANCTAIDGATSAQYVPVQDDVGHALEVQETASNSGGDSTPATSAATQPITGEVPQNTLAPSITGTPQQGQTLTEQSGWWTNQPNAFSYQWLACDATGANCVPIAGATSQTYKPGSADVGNTLEVEETASNPTGDSQPSASAATQPILPAAPVSSSPPTISGTPQQGQQLTENHAEWSNDPTSYSYQWSRCDSSGANCTPIDGATSNQYLPTQDDVNGTLEVEETASNAGGTSAPAVSAATAVVASAVPQNSVPPTIAGVPQQGQTLTEQHGTWTNQPTSYTYQWMACDAAGTNCKPINGATDDTYVVAASDVGKRLAVQEVATNAAGDGQPAQSDATTTVIPPAPMNNAPPTIAGTAHQGDTLTVQRGTWSGDTTSYSYQWLRCDSADANCQPISDASDTTYVPVGADVGDTIEVQETGQGPGGAGDPATSAPTAVVSAAAPPTATLDITPDQGTASLDATATISASDPEGRPLTYTLDFGDGTTAAAGGLPAGPISHTYSTDGAYIATLVVSDGVTSVTVTHRVVVSLAQPLTANAGDDQIGQVNQPVIFDGGASRPTAGITGYHWDFGDGSSADGSQVSHTYTTAGTYTAQLTVTSGTSSAKSSATITINPPPQTTGLTIHVTGGGSSLAGASAMIIKPDGTRQTATTNSSGDAVLANVNDGSVGVYVWASGYQPQQITATVSGGSGNASVDLPVGQPGAATLTQQRLTYDQIIADGINVNDPANTHVYEAEIHLFFVPDQPATQQNTLDVYVSPNGIQCASNCTSGLWGGGGGGGGGSGGTACIFTIDKPCFAVGPYEYEPSITYVDGDPVIQWLVIPIQASFLKEFFDVQMVIQNLTTSFSFAPGVADLSLPSGLSLAPTPTPQTQVQDVPAIPAGGSQTVDWIVRGDTEGLYDLEADYSSTIDPIEQGIYLRAETQSPLHVWGASALKTTVVVDSQAVQWAPYAITIQVQNVSNQADGVGIPIYNMQVEMQNRPSDYPSTFAKYALAPEPGTRAADGQVQEDAVIEPGQTFSAKYIVFPGIGESFPGTVDSTTYDLVPQDSFIVQTGGDVDLNPALVENPGPSAEQEAGTDGFCIGEPSGSDEGIPDACDSGIATGQAQVNWSPTAPPTGDTVQGYEFWTLESLDSGQSDWYLYKTLPASQTSLDIPPGAALGRYYAIGTELSDGTVEFAHPLLAGPARYVALGDSYSAGEGVPAFDPGTAKDVSPDPSDPNDNTCHRSIGSYGRLLAADPAVNSNLGPAVFAACSGAVTEDVETPNPANAGEIAQKDQLSPFTNTVTLTLGGNDIGFSDLAQACVVGFEGDPTSGDVGDCAAQWDLQQLLGSNGAIDKFDSIWTDLNGNPLAKLVDDVKSVGEDCPELESPLDEIMCAVDLHHVINDGDAVTKSSSWDTNRTTALRYVVDGTLVKRLERVYKDMATQAPNAHFYVLEYPQLVSNPVKGNTCELLPDVFPGSNLLSLSYNEQVAVTDVVDRLNWDIEQAAAAAGPQFEAVNPESTFAGHELCVGGVLNTATDDAHKTYFNSLVNPYISAPNDYGPLQYSFHPNKYGQAAYEQAVKAQMQSEISNQVLTVEPQQSVDAGSVQVTAPASMLQAAASVPGSNVTLKLIGPDGTTHDDQTPGVQVTTTSTGEQLDVPDPGQGTWSVEVYGQDVHSGGEPVAVSAYPVAPPPPAPPSIQISSAPVDGQANTYTLTASGSGALSYEWTFSDGETADGPSVTHTFTNSGDVWASAAGTDDSGNVGFANAELEWIGAPQAGSAPTISGSPTQGQTLTVIDGQWNGSPTAWAYQWKRCDASGMNCSDIPGATDPSYALTNDDAGATIVVEETTSNADGTSSPVDSSPTAVVIPLAPADSAPPGISGATVQGQTLTDTHGTWSNKPSSYAYQWESCDSAGDDCQPIVGATSQTYTLTDVDVGHTIVVEEIATNSGGSSDPAPSAASSVVVPPAPTSSAQPTLSGTPQQGQTLMEDHATWTGDPTSYGYQWEDCDTAGAACVDIAGATGQSYTLSGSDAGHTIRVEETATNAGGDSTPATSDPTAVVLPLPPASLGIPTIRGNAQDGQTLVEGHGSWTNNPTSYSYQWEECDSSGNSCSAISGATDASYPLTDNDVGHTLRVQETAGNAGGAGFPATSDPTRVVLPLPPASSAAPSITGHAQEGNTLSETHATWSNSPTQFAYQWLRCDSQGASCQPISGATSQTYTPTTDDVGNTLVVQEVASNAGGDGVPAESSPTNVVLPAAPVNSVPPSISGVAEQGLALTEGHGTWSGSPTSYAYQWERCDSAGANCQPISGASAQTYTPVAADVGSTLVVQETASNAGGVGSPASSPASAVVQPSVGLASVPVATAAPAVSGAARQGETLSESHGTWSPAASSYAYQWEDCDAAGANCVSIAGATGQTYTLTAEDAGYTVRVQEIASNASGSGVPADSAPTAVVTPLAPSNMAPPAISGSTTEGQTLSESHGSWANNPTSYAYQWEDCDGAGNGCTAIAGATARNYTLTNADVGHTIRVQESASNAGGGGGPTSSSATGLVGALTAPPSKPSNSSPPVISGTATIGQTLSTSTGAWSGSPPISYAYQWEVCDPSCRHIVGATTSSFTLTKSQASDRVSVVVTASNSVGSAQATSSEVGPVIPAGPTVAQVNAALTKALSAFNRGVKLASLLKSGGFRVAFTAPSAGRLVLAWYFLPKGASLPGGESRSAKKPTAKPVLVAIARVTFRRAGKVTPRVALTGRGRQLLKNATQVRLTVEATFVPIGGRTTTAQTTFKAGR